MNNFALVNFYKKGRQERGWVHSGCVRSRMLRIARYPAATPWLCPVAAPSCFAEYQAILNILPKPPPECTHPLSRLFFVSAAKRARYGLFAVVLKVPLGCAPGLFCRMPRASKYSSKAASRANQSPLLAVFCKCYKNKIDVNAIGGRSFSCSFGCFSQA